MNWVWAAVAIVAGSLIGYILVNAWTPARMRRWQERRLRRDQQEETWRNYREPYGWFK